MLINWVKNMKKEQVEFYNEIDNFLSNNHHIIVREIYCQLKEINDKKEIQSKLSVLGLNVNVEEAEVYKTYFMNYVYKYQPLRCLKHDMTPFTLQDSAKMFSYRDKKETTEYEYKDLHTFVKDFELNLYVVCAVILEQIRYRAGIYTDRKEVMFAETMFAFEAKLDDLEEEIRNLENFEEVYGKYKEIDDRYMNQSIENIKLPF